MDKKSINYERARDLARDGGEGDRTELASRADVPPEILYFLVDDPSSDVRRCLAANRATPGKADTLLAHDKEDQVRQDLAEKIARLVPELDSQEQTQVYEATMATLEILVRDQATKVRQILSEVLKDVTNAPARIINRLARDTEIVVAEPVLIFSPVLSNEDLLEIISTNSAATKRVEGALGAIAQRHELVESITDAIVQTDDLGAIALLLGNTSAQIREEALEIIIEKAPEVEAWHLPLVKRPVLPLRAAFRLAHFVAASLVDALQSRGDLSIDEISEIREIVDQRIDDGTIDPDWANSERGEKPDVVELDELWDGEGGKKKKGKPVTPIQIAEDMKENFRLDEKSVMEAMERGDVDLVIAAISVLSEIPLELIEKAMDTQDPKAVMAVCWKAGLSGELAEQTQVKIAGISEGDVVKAAGVKFPLEEVEMEEQISRLTDQTTDQDDEPGELGSFTFS